MLSKAKEAVAFFGRSSQDGRKLDFVSPLPQSVICCFCHLLLINPVQVPCGERLCERCFKKLKTKEDSPECPTCGLSFKEVKVWKDAFADREIEDLVIRCVNYADGCSWQGIVRTLKEHLPECEWEKDVCPNDGCQEEFPRLAALAHREECLFRFLKCSYCSKSFIYKQIENHYAECDKKIVRCSLCSEEMTRDKLKLHMESCPKRKKQCPFFGCLFEGDDEELQVHRSQFDTRSHIESFSDSFKANDKAVKRLAESVQEIQKEVRVFQESGRKGTLALTERVAAMETQSLDLQEHQKIMQAKILEACYQSVDNVQKDYTSKIDNLQQHLRMFTEKMLKMEEIIANQSSRMQSLQEEVNTLKGGMASGSCGVEIESSRQDRIIATHDVKLAEYGLRIDMLDCKNVEGVLLWKITEVRRRRREAVTGKTPSIYSQPFYTTGCGYKMCARAYLNGDGMGKGSHLSLFFVLMRGEYDSLLSWPFQHKVTLVLVNQEDGGDHISDAFRPDPSSSSFKKPRSEMNIASGCPLFVPLSTLENGQFIRNDSMFIKVVVDTARAFKPDGR